MYRSMIWLLMFMSLAAGASTPGYSIGGSTRGGRSSARQQAHKQQQQQCSYQSLPRAMLKLLHCNGIGQA
jgi:hypothetical protein